MAGRELLAFRGRQAGSYIFHAGDGFHYNVREVRSSRARLRCRNYKRNGLGCYGTASVSLASGLLVHCTPHNHAPDVLLEQDFDLRRNMIQEAESNVFGMKVKSILNEWKLRTNDVLLASRFTTVRMRSALYAARSKQYPTIPKTLLYLGLLLRDPNMRHICQTADGNDSIFCGIAGYQHDKTLSLIFISGRMLQFLQGRITLHSDGTFRKRSKAPNMAQIFNIVTKYGDNIVCLARVLMSSRTTSAYRAVLAFLKAKAPALSPEVVHCDFELAQMHAWQLEFPGARVAGCLWHYAVAFSSTARELGMTPLAREHDTVLSSIAALCAVPMLPSNLIWTGVLEIWREVEDSGWGDELRPLFEHFERYWLPRKDDLSVFKLADRTNNCSESDNRAIASVLPQNRPNIWHLIGGFVKLEHLAYCDKVAIDMMQQVSSGRKWKTIHNDRTVQRAVRLLEERQITLAHFLHRTSYAVLAGIKHGLRLRNQHDGEDSGGDDESN